MTMPRLLLISALLILMTCCKKTNSVATFSAKGVLTGSDTTCGGWLIEGGDGTIYEPHNLDSFPIPRADHIPVIFTYSKTQEYPMVCQMGQAIKLISIYESCFWCASPQ